MTTCSRLRKPKSNPKAAFTLIELMIVVAILGILASLAIPVFRTVLMRSKTAEASTNLSIMFKNVASYYSAERASKGQTAALFNGCTVDEVGPLPATPHAQKQRVPSDNPSFRAIGFYVGDYVYYAYGLAVDGTTGNCGGSANDPSVYTLYANGDLDDDTTLSLFELSVGSDDNNQLFHARGLYILNELE